jgi:hypothetical protein
LNILVEKFKEVLFAVLPVTIIVLILNFIITPLEAHLILRFLLGAILIVIGLSIFLFGIDIGIGPIGNLMGAALVKSNKVWIIGIVGLILGFLISIAEPDLHVLAGQVSNVTSGVISKPSLIIVVSIGIGAMLSLGLLRIVYNKPLNIVLTGLYFVILVLALFSSSEFLAISFDASGATTGAMTVPFILALGIGVSSLKGGRESEEDSFGLVAIASAGAIIAVMFMGVLTRPEGYSGGLAYDTTYSTSVIGPFIQKAPTIMLEVLYALLPILLLFYFFNIFAFKLQKKKLLKISKGLIYTFIGLVLFLTGVNAGFMEVGSAVGYNVAALDNKWVLILAGFILGLVVILAEPAVYVLTEQIENVTSGYVKRNVILFALSIGVACAVALSMLRIVVPQIQLWHYLLPGYLVSIVLTYIVPKLFVGIAFDSGGVASGPMTATFILAFAQGAAEAMEGANVLIDGFGVIAMVALTPLIALQVLGLIFKIKTVKGGLEENGEPS